MFRMYARLQWAAEQAILLNHAVLVRPMQAIRTWAWLKASAANLKLCNKR